MTDTDKLRTVVEEYIKRWDLSGYNRLYTPKEWLDRHEKIGLGADLTLVCEGEFNHLLNGYVRDYRGILGDLEDSLEKIGYWYELGYAWSVHFYKIGK
jgi:hypothetical protein